ncbi:hypothetical protein C8R47DRAFT_292779 [Mycena vitilis]|nr:hypothetical protein C8R47DRAFT_292779 [Mycena vitilis]
MVFDADITDPEALKLAATEVSRVTGGDLNFLINNAGIINHPGFTIDQLAQRLSKTSCLPVYANLARPPDNSFTISTSSQTLSAQFTPSTHHSSSQEECRQKVLTPSSTYGDLDFTLAAEATGLFDFQGRAEHGCGEIWAQFKAQDGFVFLAISTGLAKTTMLPGH